MDASTQFGMFFLVFFLLLLVTVIVSIILDKHLVDGTAAQEEDQREEESSDASYVPPVLKELSPEQIADIHARGKVTPAEYVEQWESTGTCWVISEDFAAPFCEHFRNCHDCLVAMANRADEYPSLWDYLKPYNFDI